jgi:hypothetical protein
MLKIFLELLLKSEAVVVCVIENDNDAVGETGSLTAPLRMQYELAAVTGEPENEVVHLACQTATSNLSILLSEEGIENGCFDPKTQEFRVFDHEGDEVRIRLLVNGDALCPPAGYEKQAVVFFVVQEGGSSSELYIQSFNTRASAAKYQRSCWDEASYRTSPVISVPASLADQPGFSEVVEALVRASHELDGRGED